MSTSTRSVVIALAATVFTMAYMAGMELYLIKNHNIEYGTRDMLLAMYMPQAVASLVVFGVFIKLGHDKRSLQMFKATSFSSSSQVRLQLPFFVALLLALVMYALVGNWAFSNNMMGSFAKLTILTLGIGFVEEVVFRGIVVGALMKAFNRWVALVGSAFLFGIFHLSNLAGGVPIEHALQQTQSTFFAGLIYGAALIFARIPLGAMIVAHALYDFGLMTMVFFPNITDTLPTPAMSLGIKGAMLLSLLLVLIHWVYTTKIRKPTIG